MSARLICKCPQCGRVTSDCIDSTLDKDRVEYDGKRCSRCVRTTKPNGLKKPTPIDRRPAFVTGHHLNTRSSRARTQSGMAGKYGIK